MAMNLETLRLLVAKGLSAEDILAVAETMDAPAGRSAAAERQARYRARQKTQPETVTDDVTSDVTRDATDSDAAPSLSRPPLSSPQTPQQTPPTHTHPDTKPRARKGHRLPDDWEPAPLTGEIAQVVAGWPPGAIERELARFRDWAASATGPNATKSDWQAAWRNWLRKADDDGRHRRYDRTASRNDEPQNSYVIAGFGREAERVAAER